MEIKENNKTNNFCIILAGGRGKRLWPISKESYPKQFLDFFNEGLSQLQQTYNRFLQIIPQENIYISTNEDYLNLIHKQLPYVNNEHILAEPIQRNTAPSVAWAVNRIQHINNKANIIITPSDHSIVNNKSFINDINKGFKFVAQSNYLLAIGILPNRPDETYGYIQKGDVIDNENILKVKAFTEKPDKSFAEMFVKSKEWFWNTGIYLGNVATLKKCLSKVLPPVIRSFEKTNKNYDIKQENDFVKRHFPSYTNISIDFAILEKFDKVCFLKGNFGWLDLGTWYGIYEAKHRTDSDNVIINSEVIIENSKNNIIKLSKEKIAVIDGLQGYIVAEKDGILVICKKEDASVLIRKYVNEVQLKYGDKFI